MNKIRRSVYSLTVALLVFLVLALPVLSRLYGPIVYLPAYAVVALVAGGVAWSLLGWLSGSSERSGESDIESQLSETLATNSERSAEENPEMDVEGELEDLKSKR